MKSLGLFLRPVCDRNPLLGFSPPLQGSLQVRKGWAASSETWTLPHPLPTGGQQAFPESAPRDMLPEFEMLMIMALGVTEVTGLAKGSGDSETVVCHTESLPCPLQIVINFLGNG